MNNSIFKKVLIIFLIVSFTIPAIVFGQNGNNTDSKSKKSNQNSNSPHADYEGEAPAFTEASVHDPSVIRVDETFYVFGSHLAAAKTNDLMNWEQISSNVSEENPLFENVFEELEEAFEWANSDTLWAADVRQLEDGKFYMYYNACQGDAPRSALGIAVADDIEGPYEDLGIFLKSGMWDEESPDGTIYDATVHPNAIDPETFFDKDGNLWMVYGSYSGGIFVLEMDPETGFPLPNQGYGDHLMGGNHSRIEASYIEYNAETDFYYLYVTYGGLDAVGGYNMRVARSENPDGPYYDAEGNAMSEVMGEPDTIFDDRSIEPYGVKQMGNFLFTRELGESGTGSGTGYVSPGHNSIYTDEDTGDMFMFFHARFPETGEMHEIRVHQMFMNKEGWPVVAPYRYAEEKLDKLNRKDLIGDYKFINHGKEISADIKESVTVSLDKNNKITGEVTGRWKKTGHNSAELTIDDSVYHGVFLRQWDPTSESYVMTFTASSNEGVTIWGSQMESKTDEETVTDVFNDLYLEETVISDLTLPTEGVRNTEIIWESSNTEIISETGIVNRPEMGNGNAEVELTATITKGGVTEIKSFNITVLAKGEGQLIAHYEFNGDLENSANNEDFGSGTITGNRINNEGGVISYTEGVVNSAAYFDGSSGILLPNGLISSNSYTVSLWLNPEELTDFTTSFFGARTENNWLSLLPSGIGNNNTMIWSGSNSWYDAGTDMKINVDEWSHVAFTVDEGDLTIYVDGEVRYTGSDFPNIFTTTSGHFSLGVNYWDTPYKGLMDDLQIYDEVALTVEEIEQLAEAK
ncbi:glycoside hydrolase family 43 [Salipaludibacillus neizhouensis]|uniref:Glycoside hydrolase family 43 n=1 Tax=Salipaludibacillus neizhouensis TaxID=885475 RepID=A0A3A9KUS9_9BACI|nr:family 43 glycosylhydrolase [Salipaludibacillus neizhouensis]RKL68346.1 glycoside hydrolase family 43 [Salipaludibacillus neizhouensis]